MRRRLVVAPFLALLVLVLAVLAGTPARVEAGHAAAPATVAITPAVNWTSTKADCPSGERFFPAREVAIPAPGQSVTETIGTVEWPRCAGGVSCGYNRQPGAPRLPFTVTATYECLANPVGEDGRECRLSTTSSVCRSPFTITLTAERTCECRGLRVGARGGAAIGDPDRQGRTHLRLTLRWVMTCTGGLGECRGRLTVGSPAGGPAMRLVAPSRGRAGCAGACERAQAVSRAGDVKLHGTFRGYGADDRAGRRLVIPIRTFCVRGSGEVPAGTARIAIAFDRRGLVDTARSDLNADGRPDGQQGRRR